MTYDRTNDRLLGEVVRAWVREEMEGESGAADRAVAIARDAYGAGASIFEAFGEAAEFVGCWGRHPSHATGGRRALALVS